MVIFFALLYIQAVGSVVTLFAVPRLFTGSQKHSRVTSWLTTVSPCMVSLATLATVIFLSRTWSPGKNTIVVLEVKYSSASCAYSESVVQLVEL